MHLHLGLEGNAPLLTYIASIAVFVASVFWRPDLGLYYLVLLLPLQRLRYRLHGLPLADSLLDILLLGVILGSLLRRQWEFPRDTRLNKLLVLFAIFLYVSLWRGAFYLHSSWPVWIDNPRFSDWKNYVEMPLFCVVTAALIKDVRHMKVLVLTMGFSLLLVNAGFYRTIGDRDLSHFTEDLRYAGQLGYVGVNGLAAFEAMVSIFLLGLYAFERKSLVKLAVLGLVLTCVYSLLFSFSRGGYVGFVVGLLFLGVLKERKLLVAPLLLLIGWQVFLPQSVQDRILMTHQDGELDSSAEERVVLWKDALVMFRENPLFGSGFDTYGFLGRVGKYQDTHNYYLKVLVETGVIGLMIFLWLLWKLYRLGYSLYRSAEDLFLASIGFGFAAMMVCTVVVNLFGDRWTYQQLDGYLWILLGCVLRGRVLVQAAEQAAGGDTAPVAFLSTAGNCAVPA